MQQQRRVILILSGGKVRGVYTNLKAVWNDISQNWKQSYSTVATTLNVDKEYDVGTCVFQGELLEAVKITRVSLNTLFPGI
jgi:hypothetical protein